MSAAATTLTPTNATDAQFRAWGSAIGVKLAAQGMVQTADTGQINWVTVLTPGAGNTAQGYEIWRFADTLQSTVPVFIKIEYGSGSAAANPGIWTSVGSGTNGAGTLTGIPAARQQMQFTATGTPINVFFSGDTNRFAFAFVGASAATSGAWSMERTVDASGVVTGEGVLMINYGTSATNCRAWNQVTGPYTAWETPWGALGPQQSPFGTTGTQVAVYPVLHNKGIFLQYGYNFFAYVDATIGAGSTITFPVYGSNHTFITLGAPPFGATLSRFAGTSSAMMRFE